MRRMIAATALMLPFGAWAQEWQSLTGPEITTALSARVLRYENGSSQNFFTDGRTLYEAGAGESWGRWWVSGDAYCSTWPPNQTPACYGIEARGLDIRFTGAGGDVATGRYADLD